MLQKILIAIGDVADSVQVFTAGLTLAEKMGAEILIVHVLDPLVPHGLSPVGSPLVGGVLPIINDVAIEQYTEAWKKYEQQGKEQLQAYAAQAQERGVKVEVLQNYGDAGPLICDAAKNWSADTIVIGRNQKSMLKEIFMGSNSSYVLHHAPCSVMAIQLPALPM